MGTALMIIFGVGVHCDDVLKKTKYAGTGMNCSAGSTPKTTLASAIAGLILTPPKMNKVTVIPNAHVVMANK